MADYTIPTGYWQQHDVYKRASNAAKEKMRRHYIEMQAIGMPDKVEKNILRAAKQHPTMSPGVISSLANSFEEQIALEARTQGALGRSHDYSEGVRSFLEKRKPTFEGR